MYRFNRDGPPVLGNGKSKLSIISLNYLEQLELSWTIGIILDNWNYLRKLELSRKIGIISENWNYLSHCTYYMDMVYEHYK